MTKEKIEELKQSIETSIDSIGKVTNQQEILVSVIEKSEHAEMFKSFIDETKKQTEKLYKQRDELVYRLENVSAVLESMDDENIEDAVEKLLIAIGIVKNPEEEAEEEKIEG